jgi:hypothetical protein
VTEDDESIDSYLLFAIRDAPCLAARPGELTYECSIDRPCRVCAWRKEVSARLWSEWGVRLF